MSKDICDIKELSNYLQISVSEIRKLIREKKIPYFKINSVIRFRVEKINNWLEKLEEEERKNSLFF